MRYLTKSTKVKKMKRLIQTILVAITGLSFGMIGGHYRWFGYQDSNGGISSLKGRVSDGWERGEYVTLRKSLNHGCGGQLIFNGRATPAPYSEGVNFCEHVCDKCGATNQVLNATWPKHKQEWRPL
jgi:hypothetical protein